MELRHLETLLAIAEEGSFTAAADALNTVQSNVSDQVRQLEHELGVPLLVREPARGRAHRVRHRRARARPARAARARGDARRPLDAAGARSRARAPRASSAPRAAGSCPRSSPTSASARPACGSAINEGASERLFAEVVEGELAQAVVTEPVDDRRLVVEHLLDEDARRARRHTTSPLPARAGAARGAQRARRSCSRPTRNPLRIELESVAEAAGPHARRAGRGRGHPADRRPRRRRRLRVDPARDRDPARSRRRCARSRSREMPPRRLAIVNARDAQLSLADQAVRESVRSARRRHEGVHARRPGGTVTHGPGRTVSPTAKRR